MAVPFLKSFQSVFSYLKKQPVFLLLIFTALYRVVSLPGVTGEADLALSAAAHGGVLAELGWPVVLPAGFLFKIFGAGHFSAVVLPLFISLCSVWLAFAILREELPEKSALFGALFYSVFPLAAFFGTRLHPAVFMEGLILLSVFLLQLSCKNRPGLYLMLSGFALGAAVFSESRAVWFLPFYIIYAFYLAAGRSLRPGDMKKISGVGVRGLWFAAGIALVSGVTLLLSLMTGASPFSAFRGIFSGGAPAESFEYVKQLFLQTRGYSAGMFFPLVPVALAAAVYFLIKKEKQAVVFALWMLVPICALQLFAGGSARISSAAVLIYLGLPSSALAALLFERLFSGGTFFTRITGRIVFVLFLLISLIGGIDYKSRARSLFCSYKKDSDKVLKSGKPLYFGDSRSLALFRFLSGYSLPGGVVSGVSGIVRPGVLIVARGTVREVVFNRKELSLIRSRVPSGWVKIPADAPLEIWKVVPLTNLRAAIRQNSIGKIDLMPTDVVFKKDAYVLSQSMGQFGSGWAGGGHLFIGSQKPGASVVVRFDSAASGRYSLRLSVTRAGDFGRYAVFLNGKKIFPDLNLYSAKVNRFVYAPVPVMLRKGGNRLLIRCTGKVDESSGFKGGFDTLEFKPSGR